MIHETYGVYTWQSDKAWIHSHFSTAFFRNACEPHSHSCPTALQFADM